MVEDNINLVYYIISKEYPTFIGDEDLVQSGMLGLVKASDTWDENKAKFSTYAYRCIRNEINQEFVRRKPYSNNISLETKVGEEGTLADILIGEDDVDYVDDTEFHEQLTRYELDVMALVKRGYTNAEIAVMTDTSIQKVQKTKRIIGLKWSKFYGD